MTDHTYGGGTLAQIRAAARKQPDGLYVHPSILLDMAARIEELDRDAARLDWLADPANTIGNVTPPTACVEANLHSLRAAIDMTMTQQREPA